MKVRQSFNSKWTKHLPDQEREQLKKTILASRTTLDRLKQLIIEELGTLENQEGNLADYDSPAWSHKQAHRNGERGFAKKILELITFEK